MKALPPLLLAASALLTLAACNDTPATAPTSPPTGSAIPASDPTPPIPSSDSAAPPPGESLTPPPSPSQTPPTLPEDKPPTDPMNPAAPPIPPA